MKKVSTMLLAAVVLAAIFAGCQPNKTNSSSQNSTKAYAGKTLKVLTHWTNQTSQGGGNGQYHYLDDFAKKFEKETGCTVKFTAITDYESDVKTMLAGNDYGDVLDIVSVPNTDLHTYFKPLGKSTDADLKDFYNPEQKGTKNSDGSWTIYGLSYGMGVSGVVYNKTALKKAGVETFPKTLDEFYSACEKLKKAGIVPMAINYADKWPLANWDTLAVVAAKDTDFSNKLYLDKSPFEPSKPYGISFGILNKIISKGYVESSLSTTKWEDSKSDLGIGKDAMMLLGSWAVPQMQDKDPVKDDIGFAPMPTDNSGKLYSIASPDYCMGISIHSKVSDLAKKYIMEFITSDFGQSQGFLPPKKGLTVTNQTLKNFMNSGVTLLYNKPGKNGDETSKRDKIGKEANIDFGGGTYIQAVCDASRNNTYNDELKKLNEKWSQAQKDVADE